MPQDPKDLEVTTKRDDSRTTPRTAAATLESPRPDPEEYGWTQPESSALKSLSPGQFWLAPEGS